MNDDSKINKLAVLFGGDIKVSDKITLRQPTIRELKNIDEESFFQTMNLLCSVPSDMKSFLDDMGADFSKLSDWNYFLYIYRFLPKEFTKFILGDKIDFSNMIPVPIDEEKKFFILIDRNFMDRNKDDDIFYITQKDYEGFIGYVREMMCYRVKREKAANSFTKQAMINEDRRRREKIKNNPDHGSQLIPIIITLVNTEEFSYTYETVQDITIYQLLKSNAQIQNKKSACALYQGTMSGFVDTSKLDHSLMDWTYNPEKFNKQS